MAYFCTAKTTRTPKHLQSPHVHTLHRFHVLLPRLCRLPDLLACDQLHLLPPRSRHPLRLRRLGVISPATPSLTEHPSTPSLTDLQIYSYKLQTMRDYTRNQLARRLEWMEEWSKTAPQQPTANDCPPAAVRVRNINNNDDDEW